MTAAALFRRRVDLNLIVGAKLEEQKSVGDTLPHDDKYERLREYGEVIRGILTAEGPYSHNGRWYQYDRFELSPSIDRELLPRMFVAGSSRAALLVAQSLADILVSHPPEADKFAEETRGALKQAVRPVGLGVRLGVIAREEREDAQIIALERFPQNRRGELATKLKTTAESTWIRSLAESSLKADPAQFSSVFWLGAYRSGKAYCPYLVGTYEEVAGALGQYHALGARALLVDGPDTITDFEHLDRVLEQETSFPSCSQ
jgi:alkanesulfonate monooxygenase